MNETLSNPQKFDKYGCVLIEQFIDPVTIKTVSMYLENKIRRAEWEAEANEATTCPTKLAYYADPLLETILQTSLSSVEQVCGKELHPTYSYARVYQPGEKLLPHIDRPSCEISVTVNVASKGKGSPIWMHYKNNDPISYLLNAGDAVIYKGCEAKHWRDELDKEQLNVQFMLHYVDKFGKHADKKYDSRKNLGFSYVKRRS